MMVTKSQVNDITESLDGFEKNISYINTILAELQHTELLSYFYCACT
jgi:hypothetical protein